MGWLFILLLFGFAFFRWMFLPALSFLLRLLYLNEQELVQAEWDVVQERIQKIDSTFLISLNRVRDRFGMHKV